MTSEPISLHHYVLSLGIKAPSKITAGRTASCSCLHTISYYISYLYSKERLDLATSERNCDPPGPVMIACDNQ
ncbi:hypothetical protein PILCRDRAFT_475798 [Piloderma croceum F 1598]|uniref:Uncharacterized protein n=1 Tax=Piloderma croceum (strain F 1598) TaxID=765440 RepID=A0A0C3FTW1_PILCF|nr:hypothetical protein PILCRDRAFT_475798 [Piloderma croceum F 1598]